MASNLETVILWRDAARTFEEEVLPYIIAEYEQDGVIDSIARHEAWNNWTDALCKDGEISDWQYENWTHPPCCG
jgi:hypothetical protein